MHHTRLDRLFGPGDLDGFGEPAEPVTFPRTLRYCGRHPQDDEDVFDATVGQFGADAGSELCVLGRLDPNAQNVLDAVHVDTDSDTRGLVPHMRAVSDLHHQCVQIDDRIEGAVSDERRESGVLFGTAACLSLRTAAMPPNPPPITTTCGRFDEVVELSAIPKIYRCVITARMPFPRTHST